MYIQNLGLLIDSPVSSLVADIFMDQLETNILKFGKETRQILVQVRIRYNSRFCKDIQAIKSILKIYQNQHPNKAFTKEVRNE